jgi:starch phosphorylase
VAVAYIEGEGVSSAPELGQRLTVRAVVELGGLRPDDVDVQVACGRVDETDELRHPAFVSLTCVGPVEGQYRYEGEVTLERTGPYGYSVRVLPSHPLLATPAELGLVAIPLPAAVYTDL